MKLIDKFIISVFIRYKFFFCSFLLAVALNFLLSNLVYFEIILFRDNSSFGLNYNPLSTSAVPNKNITYFLAHSLELIDTLSEDSLLISDNVNWTLSLDSYHAIEMLLWSLFTLDEIELMLKSFWDFDSILNYDNFHYQMYKIFTIYNFELKDSNNELLNNLYAQKFISYQLQFLELIEIILWKKITSFFIYNMVFFVIMTLTILFLNKSTNLIYTLLSFLLFAITCGLFIIFWGSEYIGLCVLLIYGAAIPVLALYIIMLVNVDLIQRLFFIESVKNFSVLKQIKYVLISFFFASLVFFLSKNDVTFFLSQKNYFLILIYHHVFYLNLSWRYINVIDTSYGLDHILDLPLNFYNTDLDKVASAAFKLSINELFALVLLLLVAIIVVISISWPSNNDNIILPNESHVVNWNIFYLLCTHNSYIDNLNFWLGYLFFKMREHFKKTGLPVVEEVLHFRFFVSLHSFEWVQDLGSYEYWLFPIFHWPRWRDYSHAYDYYEEYPEEFLEDRIKYWLNIEEIYYPKKWWWKISQR